MSYYNILVSTANQNHNFKILPVVGNTVDGLFGIRICQYTNESATIDSDLVYSDQNISGVQVFTHTDGFNYSINFNRLYGSSYRVINDGSFIVIGLQHDHNIIYDVNRECGYANDTFDKYDTWFITKNITPVLSLFINKKGQAPSSYSRILSRGNFILNNPNLQLGTQISNFNNVYFLESISINSYSTDTDNDGNYCINISCNNASDQVLELRQRSGVIMQNTVQLSNGFGSIRIHNDFTSCTSFDLLLDNRLLGTIHS